MALEAGSTCSSRSRCAEAPEPRQLKHAWPRTPAGGVEPRNGPRCSIIEAAIARGEFGDVYAVDGDYLYGRLQKITTGWRSGVDDYSVMLGGGVHLVDLLLWLTGQRPSAVTAVGSRMCTRGSAFRYNDFAAATFVFPGGPDGLVGRITANFGSVHRHHHVVRVFGTKATFIYDDAGARVHRSADPGQSAEWLTESPLPVSRASDPAAGRRIAPARSAPAAQHDFDVISACLAADAAIRDGERKDIEYVERQ